MSTKEKYEQTRLPMVPIRDVVIFPFMMVPFVIGRESSVNALEAALRDPSGTWIVQERIPVRRETFPMFDASGAVTDREMLVDLAPFLFRGKMSGYLTRLSATGLANVTSGGGQVPAFVVGS